MSTQQSPLRYTGRPSLEARSDSTNLAELLERILDKGIVIAGDISISLVDIELLTIKLRLLIASVDKAREIGVNWWEADPWLSGRQHDQAELGGQRASDGKSVVSGSDVEERLSRIEDALTQLTAGTGRRDRKTP